MKRIDALTFDELKAEAAAGRSLLAAVKAKRNGGDGSTLALVSLGDAVNREITEYERLPTLKSAKP